MEKQQTRTLVYDKEKAKYVLTIEEEFPMKLENREVGKQTNKMVQVWDEEELENMLIQIKDQEHEISQKLDNLKIQKKELGSFSDREKQNLKVFYEKLTQAQKLQKIEQIDEAIKNHEQALVKIRADLEELTNAREDR